MKTIKELEKEIEESSTKNCLEYDDSNKWRPMICRFCRKNYTSRGVDKHLNQVHGITRFDFGIREAILKQTKDTIEMIEKERDKLRELEKSNKKHFGDEWGNKDFARGFFQALEDIITKIKGNNKQS